MRCGAPVTGFLIGSTSVSSTPLATKRATRPFLSNENSNGTNIGSWIFVTIRLKMLNSVPSAEFLPDMMLKRAWRCSGVARSSMIGCICPLPSCSAPGKSTVAAKTTPSSLVPSKCPLVILIPTMPLHEPCVGRALKSQGQPNAQLQFLIHSPSRRQSDAAMAHLPLRCQVTMQPLDVLFSAKNPGQCRQTPHCSKEP